MARKQKETVIDPIPVSISESTQPLDLTPVKDNDAAPINTVQIALRPGQIIIKLRSGIGGQVAVSAKQYGENKAYKPDEWEILEEKKS